MSLMVAFSEETVVLRRQLRAELTEISVACAMDTTSSLIQNWAERFIGALRLSMETEEIQRNFTEVLSGILRDPLSVPFDENPLLGSDGNTYGTRALAVYIAHLPDELKGRSPISTESETPFFAATHTAATLACRFFIQRVGPLPIVLEIEREYETLKDAGRLPRIPATLVAAERRERARQFAARMNREPEQQRPVIEERISHIFDEIRQNIETESQREQERIDHIRATDIQRITELNASRDAWEQEVQDAGARIEQLQQEQRNLVGSLDTAAKDVVQLKIAIEQTRKEIAKRNSKMLNSLLVTVGIVGVSVTGGLLLPEMITLVPMADGLKVLASISL